MRPLDLRIARAMRDLLEPYHLAVVFAPAALAVFKEAGLDRPWSPYFAGRVAPLGEVSTSVVDAVFYHFDPALTGLELGHIRAADAEKLLALRLEAVDAGLRAAFEPDLLASPQLAEAAELAVEAAAACAAAPYGRPLGAANAALPVPDQPHLALWQAATTLREWRGDGHNTALLAAELDGVEALTSIVATGSERRRSLQPRRGWDDAAWQAGIDRLVGRGLLTAEGGLTPAGAELREQVESMTDRLAAAPWRALGPERCRRLHALAAPLSARVAESMGLRMPVGDFPEA
ncbi:MULTISPECIES: SCO6745 family protein [Streptacidiphilus]|uniref:SalK n=1 Tax=Streptacidiphilus cavernicola TaxID=3342716 RepID=A0ABV6UR77_9ACTN|nr:hypothetical protein [Streptacidiphilus jeojiense]